MKRLAIILIVIVLILVAAAGILLATFDVNRYRPQLVQALEKQFHRPVSVGRIGLGWNGGLAIEARSFAVYPDREGKKDPAMTLEKATALIKMMPLLEKRLEITTIVLSKPYVLVEKAPDGTLTVGGLSPSAQQKEAPSGQPGPSKPPVAISIQELNVEGARIVYRDRSSSPAMEVEAKNIDVRVRNFSMTTPFAFDGKLSVFSDAQNVSFTGQAAVPQEGSKEIPLRELTLTTDLSSLDQKKLTRAVPAIASSGLEDLKGQVQVSVKGPVVDSALKNGSLKLKGIASPVDKIDLRAIMKNDMLILEHVNAGFAGGEIKASGKITALSSPAPQLNLFAGCEAIRIEKIVPPKGGNSPSLGGQLSFSFEGGASGIQWPQISRTLGGTARVQLEDGVFLNYNALREVIKKISVIPGVEDRIRNNFPQVYQGMMNEQHTFLKPMDLTATVQNGVFYFNPLVLQTDALAIVGAGQFGLADQFLGMKASLRLNNDLSGFLIQMAGELNLLANPQGQIEIPITVQGHLPQVKVIPDTQYITSRLLASKTSELVSGLISDPKQGANTLKGLFGKATGAASSAASNAASTVTSTSSS